MISEDSPRRRVLRGTIFQMTSWREVRFTDIWREFSAADTTAMPLTHPRPPGAGLSAVPMMRDAVVEMVMGWCEQFEVVVWGHDENGLLASVIVKSDDLIPEPKWALLFSQHADKKQEEVRDKARKLLESLRSDRP